MKAVVCKEHGLPDKLDLVSDWPEPTVGEHDVLIDVKAAGLKAVPTGIAHGTVTVVGQDLVAEVTTLRRDVQSFGRHAQVAFTDDWREDAARRDFTVNALYAHLPDGVIDDYWGGLDDLSARRVRFIGDPLQRIAEDHLRILRFFRFSARFAGQIDADGLAACTARANDLMALSRERIAMELLAILALPNPKSAIGLMIDNGIFVPVLPEIADAAPLGRLLEREKALASEPDALRRLAALLPADPALAEDVGNRLRLSNAQRKQLITLASRSVDDSTNPKALAYRLGVEAAMDRLLLGTGDAAAILGWTPPRFPLTGGSIVARGIQAGPEVARVLQAAERQWIEEGFPDATRQRALAVEMVDASLPKKA